jgi:hypothetical protein
MTEKLAQQRVALNLKEEDTLDRLLASQNEKIREAIGAYKFWLAVELRKSHEMIFKLTEERDVLIRENLKLVKRLNSLERAFKGGGE